jgi:hypothetical protein
LGGGDAGVRGGGEDERSVGLKEEAARVESEAPVTGSSEDRNWR